MEALGTDLYGLLLVGVLTVGGLYFFWDKIKAKFMDK